MKCGGEGLYGRPPSLRRIILSVGARADEVGMGGPLWSPAVPRQDENPGSRVYLTFENAREQFDLRLPISK